MDEIKEAAHEKRYSVNRAVASHASSLLIFLSVCIPSSCCLIYYKIFPSSDDEEEEAPQARSKRELEVTHEEEDTKRNKR